MTYEPQEVEAKLRLERDENGARLTEAREAWKDVEAGLRARNAIGNLDVLDGLNSAVLRMRQILYGSLRDPRRIVARAPSLSPTAAEIERWKCGELGLDGMAVQDPAADDCPKCLVEEAP